MLRLEEIGPEHNGPGIRLVFEKDGKTAAVAIGHESFGHSKTVASALKTLAQMIEQHFTEPPPTG